MDYEKKYKESMAKMSTFLAKHDGFTISKDGEMYKELSEIFPELKESEDERIRSLLISSVKNEAPIANERNKELAIAWLEKQGQTFTKKEVDDAYLKGICDAKHELEKQDGQNTVVVIPKFRVGDVIRPKGSMAEYTIESISGECYHGKGWGLHICFDNDYELVEQKPADKVEPKFKIGDTVIVKPMSCHGKVFKGEPFKIVDIIKDNYVSDDGKTYSISLQDGWELVEQNTAWSEEDELRMNTVCELLPGLDLQQNWLKSLKDRVGNFDDGYKVGFSAAKHNQWKPSDEQMLAINTAINVVGKGTINGKYLIELHEQLLKLREE